MGALVDETLNDRLDRIAAKARARGVRLDPPRTEADVAAFEAGAGVRLPGDYRRFLLRVGDGPRARVGQEVRYARADEPERKRREGPPYWGLRSLDHTLDPRNVDPAGWDESAAFRPTEPFPLRARWDRPSQWDANFDGGAETLLDALNWDGHLFLGTDGCAMDWLLVVTGPARGQVWFREIDRGAWPCDPPADFVSWYERWLDGPVL